jgi:hypothetical protein
MTNFPTFFFSLICVFCSYMQSNNFYEHNGSDKHTSRSLPQKPYPSLNRDLTIKDEGDNIGLQFEDSVFEPLCVPKPQLRSRPPINFYGENSIASHSPSLMLGSMLHTNTSAFPCKITYVDKPLCPSPSVIASLTISKLYHNPHYCELREQYDYISRVLAKSMDSGITCTTTSGFPTPNLDHCVHYYLVSMFRHTNETLALHVDPITSSCVAFPSADSCMRSTLGIITQTLVKCCLWGQAMWTLTPHCLWGQATQLPKMQLLTLTTLLSSVSSNLRRCHPYGHHASSHLSSGTTQTT